MDEDYTLKYTGQQIDAGLDKAFDSASQEYVDEKLGDIETLLAQL